MEAREALRKDEVLVRNYKKQKLVISREVARAFRRHGCFDRCALMLIERVLGKLDSPVALDIGANIGNHTVVMAAHCSRVVAFEPQLRTGIRLAENIRLNQLRNVELCDFGLSDRDAEMVLFIDPDGIGGSTTFERALAPINARQVMCAVRVGDDVLGTLGVGRVDFIKLDVQGYEASALAGLTNTILSHRPIILMEWDNAVTKIAFGNLGLFDRLFAGCQFFAVESAHSRCFFPNTLVGRLRRIIHKIFMYDRLKLGEFRLEHNYDNVVFCPPEKIALLAAGTQA